MLLFPSEANKKIKVKEPELSGECGHTNKILIEQKIKPCMKKAWKKLGILPPAVVVAAVSALGQDKM